jgi:hypothetical protein
MNSKITFLAVIICGLVTSVFGQFNYKWSQTLGSPQSDHVGRTDVDDENNLYTIIQIRDTADLDAGPGTTIVFPTSSPVLAIIKSNAEGQYLWSGHFYTVGAISGSLLEVAHDQMRLTIRFTDSLLYIINGQTIIEHQQPGTHTCLLTLSPDGNVLKADYITSPYSLFFNDLLTLENGFTLINGSFQDTLVFPGAPELISVGKLDPFYMLLNPLNEVVWATSFGSADNDYPGKLVPYGESKFYFTMSHQDTVVLSTLGGIMEFPADGKYNTLVTCINLQGHFENAFGIVGELRNEVNDIAVDKDENIYVGGYYEGTINFAHPLQPPVWYTPVGSDDGFLARYSPTGLLDWVNIYISSDYSYVTNVVIERDTDLYMGLGTTGISDLDPGPDSILVDGGYDTDIVLAKLALDGTQKFAYHLKGTDVEGLLSMIVSDSRSEIILTGFYFDSLDCDPSVDEALIASAGGSDFFRIVFDEENVVTAIDYPTIVDNSRVYPNPATDYVRFETDEPVDFISIQSISGQHIRRVDFDKRLSGDLDLSDLSPGLYCITLHTQDKVVTKKVVKQ